MNDDLEPLLVEVRASTQGFAHRTSRVCAPRFDSTLLDGFDQAGSVLERGLVGAIRRGSLGFDDLKRIAAQYHERNCSAGSAQSLLQPARWRSWAAC